MKRLKVYLESQIVEEEVENEEHLFQFDYTNRLENLNISHEDNLKNLRLIKNNIKDLFEFNSERRKEVELLKVQLENDT